ncbi:MAG: family 14 glycosylhydrolase, partial [Terriglobales bacterium]
YGGVDALKNAWSMPELTVEKILPPQDTGGFFARNDHFLLQYGRDFFDWYNQSLLDHGTRMLNCALAVFGQTSSAFHGIDIGVKIPGVHWRVGHWQERSIVPGDRLAELDAGLLRTSGDDWNSDEKGHGYQPILSMLQALQSATTGSTSRIVPAFTCVEMPDGQDGPAARAMPHTLALWFGAEAQRQGLWLKGENALASDLNSPDDWNNMISLLDLPGHPGCYHGLTFLRMSDVVNSARARTTVAEILSAVRTGVPASKTAA